MTTSDGSFPSRMPLLDNGNFYMADGDKFLPQIKSLAQNDAESIGAILQSKSTELSRFHFNVIFKDKDKELKSMTVDYGTVLNDSDIPSLPLTAVKFRCGIRREKSYHTSHYIFGRIQQGNNDYFIRRRTAVNACRKRICG